MKDVISCDKSGGGANIHYIPEFPNGATRYVEDVTSRKRSKPAELKHLSKQRRRKQFSDCASSGERTRNSPNLCGYGHRGVIGLRYRLKIHSGIHLESWSIEGERPVHDMNFILSSILSTAGSETPCRNLPAPSGKAKYS